MYTYYYFTPTIHAIYVTGFGFQLVWHIQPVGLEHEPKAH